MAGAANKEIHAVAAATLNTKTVSYKEHAICEAYIRFVLALFKNRSLYFVEHTCKNQECVSGCCGMFMQKLKNVFNYDK